MLPYLPWKALIAADFQKTANAITLMDYQLPQQQLARAGERA